MFDTYGPFSIEDDDPEALKELFIDIADANPRLLRSIGVYILAAPNSNGTLIPWYVGKTLRNFKSRLTAHWNAGKFQGLIDRRKRVEVFLLPRSTPKGRVKHSTKRLKAVGKLKSIDRLEFLLIGTCLKLNSELLNKSECTFYNSLWVPGFMEAKPTEREPGAQALASLLRT